MTTVSNFKMLKEPRNTCTIVGVSGQQRKIVAERSGLGSLASKTQEQIA
jgi:hypothetical protein